MSCEHTYIAYDLVNLKVFDTLKVLLEKCTGGSDKTVDARRKEKLLVIAFRCCQYVAADFRIDLCEFTENIHEHILFAVKENIKSDRKQWLFKLMDLTLLIHVPSIGMTDNNQELEHVCDTQKWYKTLLAFDEIIDKEMHQKMNRVSRDKSVPVIELDLVASLIIARFCYYAYWNDEILKCLECTGNDNNNVLGEDTADEPSAPKRKKSSNKMQKVIDKVNSAEGFNWNWLVVLGEMIYNFPGSLEHENMFDIIKILSECQSSIVLKEQLYTFTKCCCVLLERDESFKKHANVIVYSQCEKFWHLIADQTARICTSSNKHAIESHGLLQLIIWHQKYSSDNFIKSIVKIFTTNSVVKCDYTLNTLIIILQAFNLDSLQNGTEMAGDILQYIFERITVDLLKKIQVFTVGEKPTHQIVSKLAVMCCLLKTDMIKYLNMKKSKLNETELLEKICDSEIQKIYTDQVDEILNLIQLKCNARFIITSNEYQKSTSTEQISELRSLPMPTDLKCIIDGKLYEDLMKLTEFRMKTIGDDSSIMEIKDYLLSVMDNNGLMIHLASEFLKFEAFNKEKYESSFITKKISFNLQEIERLFKLLRGKSMDRMDLNDKFNILTSIQLMFKGHYHREIGERVRSIDLKYCLRWICEQVEFEFVQYTRDRRPMKIGKNEFINAQMDEKMRMLAITTLCEYLNYDGVNENEISEYLCSNVGFHIVNNMDLHTVFRILDLFGQQEHVSMELTKWIWNVGIINICQTHGAQTYVMDCLIGKLFDIWRISKPYPELTNLVIIIYNTFSKFCVVSSKSTRTFNADLTVKYIDQFKYFHEVI